MIRLAFCLMAALALSLFSFAGPANACGKHGAHGKWKQRSHGSRVHTTTPAPRRGWQRTLRRGKHLKHGRRTMHRSMKKYARAQRRAERRALRRAEWQRRAQRRALRRAKWQRKAERRARRSAMRRSEWRRRAAMKRQRRWQARQRWLDRRMDRRRSPHMKWRTPPEPVVVAPPESRSRRRSVPYRPVEPPMDNLSSVDRLEVEIFHRINQERAKHGLGPVQLESRLSGAARRHSSEMNTLRYFDHVSPVAQNRKFTDRIRNAGIRTFSAAGENLALTGNTRDLARTFVRMWMESPGHRKNVLTRSYRYTGVGVTFGSNNRVYATQLFTGHLRGARTLKPTSPVL